MSGELVGLHSPKSGKFGVIPDAPEPVDLDELLQETKQKMCDDYCRMPEEASDQEELDELCKYCPLTDLTSDNRGMGVIEIILLLVIAIIVVLVFRDQLVELASWILRR